ncbi:MAG TPA: DUF3300 domain-containing protein [Candidatus Saccharimonadales bacterium]|nr:DUF3300 domain-containing protein [Candidatus Saccharimonadales bacterium]
MAAVLTFMGTQLFAQDGDAPPAPDSPLRSSDELNQLIGPIALYPDPLIAEILPAATFPTQIVEADRYVSDGGDPNQIEQQPWDPSVQALAHYPTVLKWMDDNLAWTTELGQAFMSQQTDVMNTIQALRGQAQSLGNLQSSPQENVVSDNGAIDIEPTDPDELYVPSYQPDLIYSQPGNYWTFGGGGFPIGLWLTHDWDWRGHHLVSWGEGHRRPQGWWHLSPQDRHTQIVSGHPSVWRPGGRSSVIVRAGDRGFERPVEGRALPAPRAFGRSSGPPERSLPTRSGPRERSVPTHGGPPERSLPQRSVPERSVPERGAPERSVPQRAAPERSVPERSAPERSVPQRTAPERSVPQRAAPEPARAAPVERAVRAEPSEGAFGGSQSSRQVHESSSRGQSSRTSGGSSNRH